MENILKYLDSIACRAICDITDISTTNLIITPTVPLRLQTSPHFSSILKRFVFN